MHEIKLFEEALWKSQQIESDDDGMTTLSDRRLEERHEMMQRSVQELSMRIFNICCMISMNEGHMIDHCKYRQPTKQHLDVKIVNTTFFAIFVKI